LSAGIHPSARVHPGAEIEPGVEIGPGTAIWAGAHVRGPARIGAECIIGERTYVAYGVEIGDRVKLNAFVYVCTAVAIEDGVMVGASTVFTNDRYPRATSPDLARLRGSGPDEHTLPTRVAEGASIGAGSVVGCDLTVGRFAMVGMGSVVTRSVPDFHLAVGNPARSVGAVCRCGEPVARFAVGRPAQFPDVVCDACGLRYTITAGAVTESAPPR
jgi:UDP-2-acetamido-3-amino-2,3-dideoxy-glucuronate N-acetyltransferase